ncbi:MAG: monovalent cation/H+ antiporter subunit D family protein [Thermodesulfobacteriota bacterium]|nr:monovalent cation/H+ antiporter subunit D family protein [Thermodesulfobacteriota bacterium]
MTYEHFAILAIIAPLMTSFLVLLLGWFRKGLCYPLTLAALFVSLISSIGILDTVMAKGTIHYHVGAWAPPWGIEIVVDYLNGFMVVMLTFIAFVVAIYSKKSLEQEIPDKIVPYYSVFLLFVAGLIGITVTGDLFNVFVFLEIASLSGYALIAVGEDGAPLAAFRYVIMGTIGACFYYLGVGYLYSVTGSLNMADLSQILPNLYHNKTVLVAFALFTVGIALKMGVFPLHAWLPDGYTRAPSTSSAIIAPMATKVMAYLLVRIFFTLFKPYFAIDFIPVTQFLTWIAAAGIIAGSILAIAQTDLKRMLAYSSVANIGYILLGIGLANQMGLIGGLLHIVNHAFMKGTLFLVTGGIVYKMGMRDITQFRGLPKKMPFTMAAFTIAALSMVGVPPTCGFFSKIYLIMGAIDAKQWFFIAVILMSSLLNVVYFFRVVQMAFFKPYEPAYAHDGGDYEKIKMDEMPLSMLIPTLILAAGIILLGVFNGDIVSNAIQHAVPVDFLR